MALSIISLPDDIFLYMLEYYFFIPLDPGSLSLGSHQGVAGRSTETLKSLSLTCRRIARLSRDVVFRDLRLKKSVGEPDLEILQSIGPHIKRLSLEIHKNGADVATILVPLTRLRSLFITGAAEFMPTWNESTIYPQLAHLSLDHGVFLLNGLGAFPALKTLQLSPARGIPPVGPPCPALHRLKLLSIPISFGPTESQALSQIFPGIKEFEARFDRIPHGELRSRLGHASLRRWLGPILALPVSRLTIGYFSTREYEIDLTKTSHMLARHYSALEYLTWRQRRLCRHTDTRRVADLLVADYRYAWDLWIIEFKVWRDQRNGDVEVVITKEWQMC